jgi:hypothetical protein
MILNVIKHGQYSLGHTKSGPPRLICISHAVKFLLILHSSPPPLPRLPPPAPQFAWIRPCGLFRSEISFGTMNSWTLVNFLVETNLS